MKKITKLPPEFNAIIKLASNGNNWCKSLYRGELLEELNDMNFDLEGIKNFDETFPQFIDWSKEKKEEKIEECEAFVDQTHKKIEQLLDAYWKRFKENRLPDLKKKYYGMN